MTSKQLAQWCAWFADNRKAENIAILDIADLSSVADFFVIVSGTSEPHLRAIKREITDRLKVDFGIQASAVDGGPNTRWQVLDYFDVVVHIMEPEVRESYDLEGLWKDAPRVTRRKPATPKKKSAPGEKANSKKQRFN